MPTIINADTSTGGAIITGDASGQLELQAAGVTKLTVSSAGVSIPTLVGSNINLATNVTGTLPAANGGTGITSPGAQGNVLTSTGTAWQSTTPAPSGTITATATGSISSGSPVLVNTNGTVSEPVTTLGPSNLSSQTVATSTNISSFNSMVYCTVPGVYVLFYGASPSNYLAGRIGTPASDGSIAWGSEFILGSIALNAHCSAVYISSDPGKCAVFVSAGGGNAGIIQVVTVSATTLTAGGTTSTARSDNKGGIAWDPVNQIGMVAGLNGGNAQMFNCAFTISGSTVTAGSAVSNTPGNEPNVEYDRNSGYFLTACRANANTICIQPSTTTSGRVVTQYTMTTVSAISPSNDNFGMVYVPGPNKILITANNNGTTTVYIYITMTGSTPSAATVFSDTSVTTTGTQSGLGLDTVTNAVVCNFRNSSGYSTVKCFLVNGTTISLGSALQIDTISNAVDGTSGKLPFDSVYARNASYYGGNTLYAKTFKAATSTLTTENFIGFSTASYTNGQTAVVTVAGGNNTAVSGVSVGVKNYVAGSSLTNSVTSLYAGIGLSATSLLVKG